MMGEIQGDPGQGPAQDETLLASARDRALGLRGKLAYYYREFKRGAQELESKRKEWAKQQRDLYLELVHLADSFEDVFRMCDQDRKLRRQKAVRECFEVTYKALLHMLEQQGIHRVPLEGKAYREVTFQGVVIPEPWEVVKASEDADTEGPKMARKVLRSLWVRVAGNKLELLRRAKVTY